MGKPTGTDLKVIPLRGELLKSLQKVELGILKDVAKFCDEHEISYFITSGTLLGAVRHGGFIPWDDDVDISMPRKDFEKFLGLKDQLPDMYICQATRFTSQYPIPIVKIRKKGTVMKEPAMAGLQIDHGVWIDVFPVDRVKNTRLLSLRAFSIALITTAINYKLGIADGIKIRTKILCRLLGILGITKLDKLRTAIMTSEEDSDGKYCTNFASNIGFRKLLLSEEVYTPSQSIVFEDCVLKAPNNPDMWLSSAYGDYMTPPPVEDRVNRHKVVEIKI